VSRIISEGEVIPEEAISSMSKLGISKWMHTWMGNRGWKQEAKRQITIKEIYHKPFKLMNTT
jgi:hypothetical protein